MRTDEYIKRNLQGFEGDMFVKAKFESLRDNYGIETVIETGTYLGGTTKVLSQMFKNVFTIEVTDEMWDKSGQYLKGINNISRIKGSSDEVLDALLDDKEFKTGTLLLFLDAHWEKACPLLGELKAVCDHGLKPVIVIHDWKVPSRPDLGFDSYNGQDFEFEWIKESIDKIYGNNGYLVEYNDKAEGAKRGVIYITPK